MYFICNQSMLSAVEIILPRKEDVIKHLFSACSLFCSIQQVQSRCYPSSKYTCLGPCCISKYYKLQSQQKISLISQNSCQRIPWHIALFFFFFSHSANILIQTSKMLADSMHSFLLHHVNLIYITGAGNNLSGPLKRCKASAQLFTKCLLQLFKSELSPLCTGVSSSFKSIYNQGRFAMFSFLFFTYSNTGIFFILLMSSLQSYS